LASGKSYDVFVSYCELTGKAVAEYFAKIFS